MQQSKGIVYYSDFNVAILIQATCLEQLKKAFLDSSPEDREVVSVTLNAPLNFGKNIVLEGERSNTMYVKQILTALEASTADIVYFCEHDVLYDKSHFDFTPNHDSIFYYNTNMYRWDYPKDRLITYDNLTSLSQMCVWREWALEHYRKRLKRIIDSGWDKEDGIGKLQPHWARALGYEPGTKRRRIGGFSDDISDRWKSSKPNIDIRHGKTLSNPKTNLSQFKHPPVNFREVTFKDIPNFNLNAMFQLGQNI